jgi:hypothetical protein
MKNRRAIVIALMFFLASCSPDGDRTRMKYTVPEKPWEAAVNRGELQDTIADVKFTSSTSPSYGNHRALIKVPSSGPAAYLNLEWRRHDRNIDTVRFCLINAETGDSVRNIHRVAVTGERCEIVFGPVTAGTYYFYYLPFMAQTGMGFYGENYLPRERPPDAAWVEAARLQEGNFADCVQAECLEIQARTQFDSFYPMEVTATEKEKAALVASDQEAKFFLFPEDRKYPIRMLDDIPQKWVLNPVQTRFRGSADRNEYYCFQIGLFAVDSTAEVKVQFHPLVGKRDTLPAASLTCFNTGGIDPSGKPFEKTVNVSKGKVQPLWIGVDIPRDITPGLYGSDLVVSTRNAGEKRVSVELDVSGTVLEDRGDSDLWRHSRLRWLNSTAGIDDETVAPHEPIRLRDDNHLELTGKEISFGESGLPSSITVRGSEVLAGPLRFVIATAGGNADFPAGNSIVLKREPGVLAREIAHSNDLLELITHAETESDGWMNYVFSLEARKDVSVTDIRLEIPFRKESSTYLMGMGLGGVAAPHSHDARWQGPHDSFWLGSTNSGLYCELRGATYAGPLLSLYRPAPPASWHNGGKGGFRIRTTGDQRSAIVFSGGRRLNKGDRIQFECAFIITPVKDLNTHGHFADRYFHDSQAPDVPDRYLASGIKVVNLHHANVYNPHINYPFVAVKEMRDFVERWHGHGMKVKIYYTIRELTNYVAEIWALRSLGNEILAGGGGGGYPWLREHFVDNYDPSWYQYLDSARVDASVVTAPGSSRWFNYYVEGLEWLVRNLGVDGLYLDDVSYDRTMLKRMRRVMERAKPGCLIDLHSNTAFSKGPAIQYTEFFPYIDKVWFGEGFHYNRMSALGWLVESSGIPFGLMGDMLPQAHNDGDSPWRGMVFGMTSRLGWTLDYSNGIRTDPTAIWKLWDEFGIADAKMVGFWEEKPIVATGDKDILATAYLKEGKMLVSLASWAREKRDARLRIDLRAAGFTPDDVKITAPPIRDFQPAREFKLNEPIPVDPAKGWLLVVERRYSDDGVSETRGR